jgi:hypothetical protein
MPRASPSAPPRSPSSLLLFFSSFSGSAIVHIADRISVNCALAEQPAKLSSQQNGAASKAQVVATGELIAFVEADVGRIPSHLDGCKFLQGRDARFWT